MQTYLYNKEKTEKIAEINLIQKDDIKEIWKDSNDDSNQTSLEEILKEELKDYNSDKKISDEIKNKLEYVYQYKELTELPTKMSVSEIKKIKNTKSEENEKKEEIENLAKPKFLEEIAEKSLTAVEKGSIMHLCMQ